MIKVFILSVIFLNVLLYSQNKSTEIEDFNVGTHFPKEGAGDYMYEKDLSDNDYQVIAGPSLDNQPIKMQLEVKNNRAKLYMYIKNTGDPATSLSFSKIKFKLHDHEISYVIKESGNSENISYRWFQVDDNLLQMIRHSDQKGCEVSYEFVKISQKGVIAKKNIDSIMQMIDIISLMGGT